MKVSFTAGSAPTFEFDGGSPKEIFEKLALVQSLFNEHECGCCGSARIAYYKRDVDNGCYLELRCLDCRAQLDFGQNKDGKGIFLKNWDKENKRPMPNRGWYVYQKSGDSAPAADTKPVRPFSQEGYQAPRQPETREDIPF